MRRRETSMCGCLLCFPYWGPGPQPRNVSWLGIEPATLWFAARAQSTEPHQPGCSVSLRMNISQPHWWGMKPLSSQWEYRACEQRETWDRTSCAIKGLHQKTASVENPPGWDSKSCEKVTKGLNQGSWWCDITGEAGNPVRSLFSY